MLRQSTRRFSILFGSSPEVPTGMETSKLNLLGAINKALDTILENDKHACLFGEDVAFGGVFRCSEGLRKKHGADRVFNTPLCEQGIVAFGIGLASVGVTAIAEIQFADYMFPAFDQIVTEAAKFRYRTGGVFNCGPLIVRAPNGAVGHGAIYHSQSPETYYAHTPGLKVVIPRGPVQAKGLLLAAAKDQNPVIFFEPKSLYRMATGQVPDDYYEIPIGKCEVVKEGQNVTIVGWGYNLVFIEKAINRAEQELGITCELIDVRSLLPFDADTVVRSVEKTGRAVVCHEDTRTAGFGAEISATIQEKCFLQLEAPVKRVCGYDTPFPHVYEKLYYPDEHKIFEAIKETVEF